jgi:hypothetical protein
MLDQPDVAGRTALHEKGQRRDGRGEGEKRPLFWRGQASPWTHPRRHLARRRPCARLRSSDLAFLVSKVLRDERASTLTVHQTVTNFSRRRHLRERPFDLNRTIARATVFMTPHRTSPARELIFRYARFHADD